MSLRCRGSAAPRQAPASNASTRATSAGTSTPTLSWATRATAMGDTVLERSELFQFLGRLKRRHREGHEAQQRLPPEPVDPEVLQERERRKLLGSRSAREITKIRHRPAREVEGASVHRDDRLHHIGIIELGEIVDRRRRGGHPVLGQERGHGVDHRRIHQRFVALDVHVPVGDDPAGHLGDAVRPARMVGPGHLDPAELGRHFGDPHVVRRHDDIRQRSRRTAPLHDMLHERLASDEVQRFAGEPGGSEAGGDDADDLHAPD